MWRTKSSSYFDVYLELLNDLVGITAQNVVLMLQYGLTLGANVTLMDKSVGANVTFMDKPTSANVTLMDKSMRFLLIPLIFLPEFDNFAKKLLSNLSLRDHGTRSDHCVRKQPNFCSVTESSKPELTKNPVWNPISENMKIIK